MDASNSNGGNARKFQGNLNGQQSNSSLVKSNSNGLFGCAAAGTNMFKPKLGNMDSFLFEATTPSNIKGAGQKMNVGANVFKPTVVGGPVMKPKPIAMLNRGSTSDDGPLIVSSPTPIKTTGLGKAPAFPTPIGTMTPGYSPTEKQEVAEFTTDCARGGRWIGSRYVVVKDIEASKWAESGTACNSLGLQTKVRDQSFVHVPPHMLSWYLRFNNIDDVNEAIEALQSVESKWTVEVTSQAEFVQSLENQTGGCRPDPPSHMYEAQVRFSATFNGLSKNAFSIDAVELRKSMKQFAVGFGKLIAFTMLDDAVHPYFEFRVEYADIRSALKAIAACAPAPATVSDFKVSAKQYASTAYSAQPSPSADSVSAAMNSLALTPTNGQQALYGLPQTSPSGRSSWVLDQAGNATLLPQPRPVPQVPSATPHFMTPQRQQQWNGLQMFTPGQCMDPYAFALDLPVSYYTPAMGGRLQRREAQNQDVTMDKLERGIDTRTTLMLRNMPNNLKADGFKALLDAAVPGKYDFSYLRIDFAQDKNVGYGFVNFSNCDDIKQFIIHYQNAPWTRTSPKKMSDYSYATIQGLEGLIEKFRNSAIMDEFPDHRPKLWWTEETIPDDHSMWMIGQERPMPDANNMSKKQRSQDNAQQIGLFPPKSNSVTRDGRQFRGRFDRGTTPQQREEARYFQQTTPPPFGMPTYGAPYQPSPYHSNPYSGTPFDTGFANYGAPAPNSSYGGAQRQPGFAAPPATPSARYNGNGMYKSMSAPRSVMQFPVHSPTPAGGAPLQRSISNQAYNSPAYANPFAANVSSPLKENWDGAAFGQRQ